MIDANCTASIEAKIHYLKGLQAHLLSTSKAYNFGPQAKAVHRRHLFAINNAIEFYSALEQDEITDLYQCFIPAHLHHKKQPALSLDNNSLQLVKEQLEGCLLNNPKPVAQALLRDVNLLQINGYPDYFTFYVHTRQGKELLFNPPKVAGNLPPGQSARGSAQFNLN
jgi:hypothetical protein